MNMTHEETVLHLKKWQEAKTLINVCIRHPEVTLQSCFGGHVTTFSERLEFSCTGGNSNGYLILSWLDVDRIEYIELRDAAVGLSTIPGAEEFMRERSNLAFFLIGGIIVLLTDLTV